MKFGYKITAVHASRTGQGDEHLPLQIQVPYGERLFGILALREMIDL